MAISGVENRRTECVQLIDYHLSDAAENPWKEFPFLKGALSRTYRQPQQFEDIYQAKPEDFIKAIERIYRSKSALSFIILNQIK